jgi:site-specific recombinase XerD
MSTNAPALCPPAGTIATLDGVRTYLDASRAASTKAAYRTDWADFTRWCDAQGLPALPAGPETVAYYLAALANAGKKAATIGRRLAAIRYAHKLVSLPSPTESALVEEAHRGIRRTIGTAQRAKAPLVTEDLRALVATCPDSLLGLRNRALLLVGFAGAFRRSELVGLQVDDVEACAEGVKITLRRSKSDQEGEGRVIAIPYGKQLVTCPVRALQTWQQAAGVAQGALFRAISRHGGVGGALSPIDVARIVKKAAHAAGYDPARFAGHSLRAGLATSAAAAGCPERVIMMTTGHKSEKMVRRYIRSGVMFQENAAASAGL